MLILVTGGTKSGKSAFAESLAKASGKEVIYIATATVEDEEMARRIERHQKRRPPEWKTIEEPFDVAGVIARNNGSDKLILIDCLALYLSNLLRKTGNQPNIENVNFSTDDEDRILAAIRHLGEVITLSSAEIIIVTNETGWGLVPAYPLGRLYRDLLGMVNQRLAAIAHQVYLVVCGLPLELKSKRQ